MRFLYKTATNAYVMFVHAVAPFNKKAKEWVFGRKSQKSHIMDIAIEQPLIWFHCASLGEFEQGKLVIDSFKKEHPNWRILITFFSPSGYEIRKDYENADYVFYLPIENKKNLKLFFSKFNPQIAVFIKYEFWYDYIQELYSRSIPLVFISSTFRKNQLFFKAYGSWFLDQLNKVKMFFVQDHESQRLLVQNGITHVKVSGDTRFDRVMKTVNDNEDLPWLKEFKDGGKVLIFGSAWENETQFFLKVLETLPQNWKVIFAPHEISQSNLSELQNRINVQSVKFSNLDNENAGKSKVLFIDTIGHLARMYKYSDIAVVGGGFSDGIHNILEPLAFGSPVFFGPNHKGFGEGEDSINCGVGNEILNYKDFAEQVGSLIGNPKALEKLQRESVDFIETRGGATEIVSAYLNKIV